MDRIIKAVFGGTKSTVTAPLWQYDYGQQMEIVNSRLRSPYEVHFSNQEYSGSSKTVIAVDGVCDIPDEYLINGEPIYAWIYYHDGESDGKTVFSIKIPVKKRSAISNAEPTPQQQDVITQTIALLTASVDHVEDIADEIPNIINSALQEAKDSGEFDGPQGLKGDPGTTDYNELTNVPTAFPPEAHTHDDRYYTEQETDALLADKADVITRTASGNIVSIPDGTAQHVLGLSVNVEPVQDLHGYDSPWPAGGGKNLFGGNFGGLFALHIQSGTTLVAYSDTKTIIRYYASDGVTEIDYWTVNVERTDGFTKKFITKEEAFYFKFEMVTGNATATKMYIAAENDFSGYTPYSNVCPISGWSQATVMRTGKNLCLEVLDNAMTLTNDVYSYLTTNDGTTALINCKKGYTYFVSGAVGRNRGLVSYFNDYPEINGTSSVYPNTTLGGDSSKGEGVFTATYTGIAAIYLANYILEDVNIQVELGTTATAYEPYSGQTVEVTFPTEAGTVYGGTVDVTNGTLTVTHGLRTYDGSDDENISLGWEYNGSTFMSNIFILPNADIKKSTAQDVSDLKANWVRPFYKDDSAYRDEWTCRRRNNQAQILLYTPSSTTNTITLASLKTMLEDTPLQLFYELATPFTVTLTPQQLTLLLGDNNVWADTGDTSVVYHADTGRYIDSKLADLKAELQALILES